MNIKPRLGGGKSGDPSLYIDLIDLKRALLFDCGYNNFRHARLRKVSDLFVSHTHIDHFIGFDNLLRLNLSETKTIRVYGPPGISKNVCGKLQGYTWNICQNLRLKIVVHEILPEHIRVTELESCRGFKAIHAEERQHSDLLLETEEFSVSYIRLDHKIPSFGYCFVEADSCNVRKEVLDSLGLPPGPWVATLKAQALQPDLQENILYIEDSAYSIGELAQKLLVRKSGMKITYLSDFIFDETYIDAIAQFAWKSDALFCEAAFSERDREKARNTHHLTAKESGILARMAQVKQLVLFHFSRRYQDYSPLLEEARQEFPHVE